MPQPDETHDDQDDFRFSLPVTDLPQVRAFYEGLGFANNPQFSDDTAACMAWSETVNVMLLTHAKWRSLTSRPISPGGSSEVMLAVSCDSRNAVAPVVPRYRRGLRLRL